MAEDHRRLAEGVAQAILLDDPTFLKEIVERVLQELLEAEMTEHIGAARYEKARMGGRVVSQGVLIVAGVREDGFREILGVEVADTESEATYHELFRSLKARGLSGVELVTSDEHEGLKAAIARHFQGASHQRCQVHYARNLLGMVGHAKRKELAEG